jgi:hypothetical protein
MKEEKGDLIQEEKKAINRVDAKRLGTECKSSIMKKLIKKKAVIETFEFETAK